MDAAVAGLNQRRLASLHAAAHQSESDPLATPFGPNARTVAATQAHAELAAALSADTNAVVTYKELLNALTRSWDAVERST